MTSIIRVKYIEKTISTEEDKNLEATSTEKEMLININCPIKLILDHIRSVADLSATCEFDLYDEINCQLKNVSVFEPCTSGLDVLQGDLTYLIITYQRSADGQMINFTPLCGGKALKKCSETFSNIRKASRKNSSIKSLTKRDNNSRKGI